MKKFYALALAAAAALTVNAQNGAPLYATGAGTGFPAAWAPGNPAEFVYADGVYTLDLTNASSFKISTAKDGEDVAAAWDGFNTGILVPERSYEEADLGKPVALVAGDNNSPNIETPWEGDYKIVVAGDLSTITMTTTTPKPTGFTKVYFRGDMNNWGNGEGDLDAWEFSTTDGVVYTFVCGEDQSIPAGVAFKIADANWQKINCGGYADGGSNEALELDTDYVLAKNSPDNLTFAEDWSGSCVLNVTDLNNPSVIFNSEKEISGVEGIETEVNNAPAVYYNLQGVRVANAENGLFIVKKGNKVSKVFVK